jgi:ribosomal protein S18 acetylase RimI-like enzyme
MKGESFDGELHLLEGMSEDDWQIISSNLRQYNIEQSSGISIKPGVRIAFTLKNSKGKTMGGIACRTFYQSLTIDHLWIDEKYRGKGFGRQLVTKVEEIARDEGCISANTSSYSFQSPEFYQKIGYKIVGVFEEYPNGIKKFFFGKTL